MSKGFWDYHYNAPVDRRDVRSFVPDKAWSVIPAGFEVYTPEPTMGRRSIFDPRVGRFVGWITEARYREWRRE